jgi:diguanylate cyclase (GGDEF)-like protein
MTQLCGAIVRILVIDDEAAIHDAYRKSFEARQSSLDQASLAAMADALFGNMDSSEPSAFPSDEFELVHAMQGLDGLRQVAEALACNNPFQIAFVDVRMPPGIDGKETAKRIREIDPNINLVIVTGYSDYTALDIASVAGPVDRLFYISKPFDPEELVHTARALGQRWFSDQEMSRIRTALADQVKALELQGIELAANEARANHLATHDSLTGAANRYAFLKILSEAIQKADREISVAIVDLDRFKNINDSLGHFAGDELIRQVCQSMVAAVGNKGFVARLGGDEFALMLNDIPENQLQAFGEKVIASCSRDFSIFGHNVKVGASIGIAQQEDIKSDDPIDLMRFADIALYDAKKKGGGQVRFFDQSMDESVRFRQSIEDGLRRAINQSELSVLYQPIVDRDNSKIVGFEALLRWDSAEHGSVSPAVFIPIAEETSLIQELGDWVSDQALRASLSWPTQYISINFSPRQFHRTDFAVRLLEQVKAAGVAPQRVQIEITETAIFDDDQGAAETISTLRDMGFRIALDDFGTGYSSLFNIRNFPLDCIKIDKSFVESMGREAQSAAIVNAVSHLARSLGIGVVAEGVETEMQFQALRLSGCTHMQGYLFGEPMTNTAVSDFLKRYEATHPVSARLAV